ncbi:T-lymphocyte activation antigen CD80-like isoform X2 [Coregonus clupeaformis]|uniref:T-lymphocyte activation antigen CD80-like isoform X2 n=1 Tax=Coregonus clupeaformis TaxID=59861 RepID=UPI001BE04A23|nr:T-lymphocyte activation antigen CD80-like isoform X2 [Coregonus clupeaformis]
MDVDNGMCACWLLRYVLFFLVSLPFLQSEDVTMVIGEVGGSVTIPCTSDLQEKSLDFMYVQRPGSNGNSSRFINGYHTKKHIELTEYTNRTRVDHTQRTMKLWSIRPSDEGLYVCHIQYQTKIILENIQLKVTANYSIPNVTVACDNGSCLVTCSSDSGYPRRDVEWSPNPPLNQSHWRAVNSSGRRDPVTTLFSVFSSISVNCSSGPQLNLSCAVGGALSQEHTVCRPQTGSPDYYVISAVVAGAVALLCFLLIGLFVFKERKARTARVNQDGEEAARTAERVQLTCMNTHS